VPAAAAPAAAAPAISAAACDMCRRHVERDADHPDRFRLIPKDDDDDGNGDGGGRGGEGEEILFLFVVDVLCANVHCLYRSEETWFKWAASRRGLFRTCGSGACLTLNSCSLVALPPLLQQQQQKQMSAAAAAAAEAAPIRRRRLLLDLSVD